MADPVDLLFAVDDPQEAAVASIASLVRELNQDREWSCGDITFVNEIDETSVGRPGDEPIWTLGGVLPLTRPTDDARSERSQLEDVEALVERLCRFTADGSALVVEYDGEEVGAIADGRADASLHEGLLAEWAKRLLEQ